MFSAKDKNILEGSFRHECNLPATEDILARYISDGYFVNFRRKFRNFVMCSAKNRRAKMHLKSTAAINYERANHLQKYYWMIHPYSTFRVVWEPFMMVVLLTLLTYIPFESFILLANRSKIPKACLDIICILDIIINFRCGFQHSLTKRIIMDPREVALLVSCLSNFIPTLCALLIRNYLKTWFVIDVIATINADLLGKLICVNPQYIYMKVPSFLRIFRLMTLLKYLDRTRELTQVSLQLHKIVKLSLVVYVLVTWLTCFLYGLAKLLEENWFVNSRQKTEAYRLRLCFFRVISMFLLANDGDVKTQSIVILICEMFWMTCGFIAKLMIMGQLAQMVLKYTTLRDEYYEIVQHFREYMKSKNLPTSVRKKVFNFLDFRYQCKFYREGELLDGLSTQLRQEVNLHAGKELLRKSVLFTGLPESLISRIAYAMTQEIYLPNEVVVAAGSQAEMMYFMYLGMVAIYSKNGKEICHLGDDSCFGEAALFSSNRERSATVVAIDFCELYVLKRDWFIKVVAPYPEMLEKVMKICRDRWLKYVEGREREGVVGDAEKVVRNYVHNI